METTFAIGVANNITMLLGLGFLYALSVRRWEIDTRTGKIVVGFLFGIVAMIGMLFPVRYAPGLIFDGRTILLGTIGFFGGGVAAAIAAIMTALLRFWQGGVGMQMGIATIISAALVGILFHRLRPHYGWLIRLPALYGFGLIIHILMLACTVFLPENLRQTVLSEIAAPVLLVYPLGTMLYCRLIVELEKRNHALAALRESEQLYAALAEASTFGIILRDPANRIVYVNQATSTMLEATPEQLVGLNYIDFVHPEDQAGSLQRIQENNRGKTTAQREHRLVSRRGKIIGVESTGVPILRAGKTYIMGVFNDISERIRMERALRENEERYRAMMQQSTEAIVIADIQTKRILEVNDRCLAMFGYSQEEMLALTTYDMVADSRENIDRRSVAIEAGSEPDGRLLKIRRKDGQIVEVERSATVIEYGGKKVFMFVNRDLSAERKLQSLILRDVAMAAGVQKDLLPTGFNDLLVSVETIYEPHHLVSGDFFDFKWSEDHQRFLGFILDVSGHGVSSALQCIAVSTYFRDVLDSPMRLDAKLRWVNRNVMRYFTHETFAAAICFELDFYRKTLSFATAGIYGFLAFTSDLPKVVKQPGSLLGLLEEPEYTEWSIPVQTGDSFYFMSDGLFEMVSGKAELPQDNFRKMVKYLRGKAASQDRRDDCSAVCIRINDRPRFPVRLEYHRYGEYERIRGRIRDLLLKISERDAARTEIAIGEALANAARESMDVRVKISLFGKLLIVRVKDGGNGFDGNRKVAEYQAVDREEAFIAKLYAEGGRGILIMMSWMDQVVYNRKGNEVMMVRRLG